MPPLPSVFRPNWYTYFPDTPAPVALAATDFVPPPPFRAPFATGFFAALLVDVRVVTFAGTAFFSRAAGFAVFVFAIYSVLRHDFRNIRDAQDQVAECCH
jgi:hypothetical protein